VSHLFVQWIISAAAIWITAQVLPGFKIEGFGAALLAAAVFGVVNFFIGWFFYVLIGIGTLGLGFLLSVVTKTIVTAIVLKITDSVMSSFHIRSFGVAVVAAIIMALLSSLAEYMLRHL
jgi:putative membrane protein